jgi:hypothetical protein
LGPPSLYDLPGGRRRCRDQAGCHPRLTGQYRTQAGTQQRMFVDHQDALRQASVCCARKQNLTHHHGVIDRTGIVTYREHGDTFLAEESPAVPTSIEYLNPRL